MQSVDVGSLILSEYIYTEPRSHVTRFFHPGLEYTSCTHRIEY